MSDGKYFATTKKGEILELSVDLNDTDKEKVKDAVKKVIAAMTLGKDVSSLFPDVIKSMATQDIELKKLVYLYIINYARSQPEKAILVVNMFQKDAKTHPNPLVRALAIRTLGCIRVDRIMEHIVNPLQHALQDPDPYVRKTAALAVAKLYDMNPELTEECGLVDALRKLLDDSNAMVLANAVGALTEMSESAERDFLQLTKSSIVKMLTAINECSEWGRVFLLDMLAKHDPDSESTAIDVSERVTPQLNHANPAVVMSAVKLIIKYLEFINTQNAKQKMCKKLAPPLVTLLSGEPEIQYVALRNVNLIVQKYPQILSNEMRVFFCKYNDAPYVKIEKLETMIKLANERNIEQVLAELKEYAQEVDVEFVRKAVRAIGRCAIKLEAAAQRCISVLMELVANRADYVVQEAVIVIKDIFRRYPGKYEKVIAQLRENLETLDEPEAKASMIWIIGEYADRITDAAERLQFFVDSFEEEPLQVQLQILTAAVKLFLKNPKSSKELVQKVLNIATERSDNPDLRDRGYVYWRLLSANPQAARDVVLAERPEISCDTFQIDDDYLARLMANISTLASVYHKPPEAFVKNYKTVEFKVLAGDDEDPDSSADEDSSDSSDSDSEEEVQPKRAQKKAAPKPAQTDLLGDFLNLGAPPSQPAAPVQQTGGLDDFLNFGLGGSSAPAAPSGKLVLNANDGKGLEIHVSYEQNTMILNLTNKGGSVINNYQLKFDKNNLGLTSASQPPLSGSISPGASQSVRIPLRLDSNFVKDQASFSVKLAIKTELGVGFFKDDIDPSIILTPQKMEAQAYGGQWKSFGKDTESVVAEQLKDITSLRSKYETFQREVPGKGTMSFWAVLVNGGMVMVQLIILPTGRCKIATRSQDAVMAKLVARAVNGMISA